MQNRMFQVMVVVVVMAMVIGITGLVISPVMAAKPSPVEAYGNNLSTPAIFAEGIGLTGLPTAEVTGLRGGVDPYLVEPYLYNGINYYLQQTQNTWQADWANGADGGESVRVDWSDNIVRQTWTETSVIRVETVLFQDLVSNLFAYDMTYLFGEGLDEVWGTTGIKSLSALATIYSICARLTIQKITGPSGSVVGTLYDSAIYQRFGVDGPTTAYSAEINVPGKIIYGYNWDLGKFDMASIGLPNEPKSGWYRLSFNLDPVADYTVTDPTGVVRTFSVPRNAILAYLDAADLLGNAVPEVVLYEPKLPSGELTYIEVYVKPKNAGKK